MKTQIALLSVSIAEKIIKEKLDASKQSDLINNLLKDVKLS
jgi:F0F1-type ATP synthase membrane subunit b/b'